MQAVGSWDSKRATTVDTREPPATLSGRGHQWVAFFENDKVMDSNAVFAVLLLIIALAILLSEVFVPSGGLLGMITFFTLAVSVLFAYRAWGTSHPNIFAVFCIFILLLVPTVIAFGFYMLPKTSFGKRVLLEAPETESVTPFAKEWSHLERMVGQYGVAVTMLHPGGLVRIGNERFHATSDGLSIDSGESIKVISVVGANLVVRPESPPEEPPESELKPPSDAPSSFDFDFPPTT